MSARRKVINKLINLFTKGDDVANAYRPGYVYKTVNTVDGMKYIGSKLGPKGHKGTYFNDKYYGSGPQLKKAIDKYGIDKFINVKQLDTRTLPGLKKAEQGLLNTVGARQDPTYYNRHNHYSGGGDVTEITRKKMGKANSIKNKGRKHTQEAKKNMSESAKKRKTVGRTMSEEVKRKISKTLTGQQSPNKGKKMSEEARKKISIARKGKPAWNKGKTMSEETKRRISESQNKRFKGLLDD